MERTVAELIQIINDFSCEIAEIESKMKSCPVDHAKVYCGHCLELTSTSILTTYARDDVYQELLKRDPEAARLYNF